MTSQVWNIWKGRISRVWQRSNLRSIGFDFKRRNKNTSDWEASIFKMGSLPESNDESCQARGGLATDEKIKLITRNLQVCNLNTIS